jgi:hypothetical protein
MITTMKQAPAGKTRLRGPTETISASIPSVLAAEVRSRVGKREFSEFVARSIAKELVDCNRAEYVAGVEQRTGPLDPELVAALERILAR